MRRYDLRWLAARRTQAGARDVSCSWADCAWASSLQPFRRHPGNRRRIQQPHSGVLGLLSPEW